MYGTSDTDDAFSSQISFSTYVEGGERGDWEMQGSSDSSPVRAENIAGGLSGSFRESYRKSGLSTDKEGASGRRERKASDFLCGKSDKE